jgi:ubiquinone/menaquinone biosynthesis C-methylase UbiE
MLTRSDDYVAYCRETAKRARDPHDLALRGGDAHEITRATYERIAEVTGLNANDELLDIGCGDGTLLRMAKRIGAHSAVGLLATDEEVAIVRQMNLDVRQGFTHQLPLSDSFASVVVCNNVLLIVPRMQIPASLREIYRVAKPGARIFLGEIPFLEPHDPTPRFNTHAELLSHLYRHNGVRTWLGMVRRMAWWKITGTPPVVYPGTAVSFWAPPDQFISMAESVGLELIRYWQHEYIDTRNNYFFRKPN